MNIGVRHPLAHEIEAFSWCLDESFAVQSSIEERERFLSGLDGQYLLGAYDGSDLVGTLTSHPCDLTLPGPSPTPVAVICDVGVLPTHRNQGVFERLMTKALGDLHEAGDSIAILHASNGGIYERFGFNICSYAARYRIERGDVRALKELTTIDHGIVRIMTLEEARTCLPEVFDEVRRHSVGEVVRHASWWEEYFERAVAERWHYYCFELDGTIDGYAIYERRVGAGSLSGETHLVELCAVSAQATRALFGVVCAVGHDDVMTTGDRPIDDPLRHLLRNQRSLSIVSLVDQMWLRLLDVPKALLARSYRHQGAIVIEVTDELCRWNEGRYRVAVGADFVPRIEATSQPAELVFDARDLAAVLLGTSSVSNLAISSSIVEQSNGAIERADLLFRTSSAPFCASSF